MDFDMSEFQPPTGLMEAFNRHNIDLDEASTVIVSDEEEPEEDENPLGTVAEPAPVVEAVQTFPSFVEAVTFAKADGTLMDDGSYKSAKTGKHTVYLCCSKKIRHKKGGPPASGCMAKVRVERLDDGPLPPFNWTVRVDTAHDPNCDNLNKLHGIPRAERDRITSDFKTPQEALNDRVNDVRSLPQLRNAFNYDGRLRAKFLSMSADAIRTVIIEEMRKVFPESEWPWLNNFVVIVERWENDSGGVDTVLFLSTQALLDSARTYEVGGIDSTYNITPRQSVAMVFGVYHERAFLPIAIAISSSRVPGRILKKGFGAHGESQRHYITFLGMVHSRCREYQAEVFHPQRGTANTQCSRSPLARATRHK